MVQFGVGKVFTKSIHTSQTPDFHTLNFKLSLTYDVHFYIKVILKVQL